MTSLIPLYLKTRYKKDPIFKNSKSVFTVYNNAFNHKFGKDLSGKVRTSDIDEKMLNNLTKTSDFEGFIRIGMEYSDAVIRAESEYSSSITKIMEEAEKEKKKKFNAIIGQEDVEELYYNFYNELAG